VSYELPATSYELRAQPAESDYLSLRDTDYGLLTTDYDPRHGGRS